VTAVFLVIALLFGTVECKTSCTRETCETKAPPCHPQKSVRACTSELIVDRPAVVVAIAIQPVAEISIAMEPVCTKEALGAAPPLVLSSPPLRI